MWKKRVAIFILDIYYKWSDLKSLLKKGKSYLNDDWSLQVQVTPSFPVSILGIFIPLSLRFSSTFFYIAFCVAKSLSRINGTVKKYE